MKLQKNCLTRTTLLAIGNSAVGEVVCSSIPQISAQSPNLQATFQSLHAGSNTHSRTRYSDDGSGHRGMPFIVRISSFEKLVIAAAIRYFDIGNWQFRLLTHMREFPYPAYKDHRCKAIPVIWPILWWSQLRPCIVTMLGYKAIQLM